MATGADSAPETPTIAIILPAYNEEGRIARTIESLARYRAGGARVGPIVLADDGSDDRTIQVARATAHACDLPLEILSFPHRGKALTVRTAMLDLVGRTSADFLMMLDADDELAIDQLDLIDWSDDPLTVYIGRRVESAGAGVGIRPTVMRRLMSSTMRLASRILLGIGFPDTQCGFKLFPAPLVAELFGQQRSSGWTFDAELLFIVDRVSGLRVQEVPITWIPRGTSHVRPLSAVLSGFAMFGTFIRRIRRSYVPIVATRRTTSRPTIAPAALAAPHPAP